MLDPLEDYREFIYEYFQSVDHFRVLLLLLDDPDRYWLPSEVVGRLRLPPPIAECSLSDLRAKGLLTFLESNGSYRYAPESRDLADKIAKLAGFDRERPVSLIRMIYSRPTEPQAFADAFRIRKRKDK